MSGSLSPSVPSMMDIFQSGKSNLKNKKMQRSANALQWRQKYQKSPMYEITLENKMSFRFNQIGNGEMKGIGTGAVVWPAAHVLAMYMEKRFGSRGLVGARVCDIGSGTGITGIIAGALGALQSLLTDQTTVQGLLEENIQLCSDMVSPGSVRFEEFDWDASPSHLNPPFDLILVSDCVLPKLYPIEPLVKAVCSLMSNSSVAFFSYEHRPFPDFDPRQEFCRLANLYGLQVEKVPIDEHHAYYCSDEIEIWEVTTLQFQQDPSSNIHAQRILRQSSRTSESSLTLLNWGSVETVRAVLQVSDCGSSSGSSQSIELLMKQNIHDGIGNYLWPSSVVMSRFLLKNPSLEALQSIIARSNSIVDDSTPFPWVLDIGAGCGLTSVVLGKIIGCGVLAVDKASVVDLLTENIHVNCATSSPGADFTRVVKTRSFDWASALDATDESILKSLQWKVDGAEDVKEEFKNSAVQYHYPSMIVLSDCFYQFDAVEPLLKLLDVMAGNRTFILVANELRTAFDEFLNKMRNQERQWKSEEIALNESDMEIYTGFKGDFASRPSRLLLFYR